ncbi:MAG: threonine--tRNA ligase [Woeseiaceae bacterium]|tara:strand:- start:11742 stop:13667 length:1926 start_codon:yes stop_codon:yes gene_type:complete
MLTIKLPDGSEKHFEKPTNGIEIAESIGENLAKAAVAIEIDGKQHDLSDEISNDAMVSIITLNSDAGLEIMRHTLTAQVLARAVKNLYPNSKLAIGPTVTDGFYYDFEIDKQLSIDDLPKIEEEMKKIIKQESKIIKSFHSKKDAISLFEKKSENYKIEIIKNSDQEDNFQIYQQGDSDFIDLCRGPHLRSLKQIGSFKLTKISGAYWKGNAENQMLQRIYGTAWLNNKDLRKHLTKLEEAEKRDHRKLAKQMDLFHFQEEAPGAVFWHPKGWNLFQKLIDYMRKKQTDAGYHEVNTPELMDRSLWEASGHWESFGENMFTSDSGDGRKYAIKPMNCPGHVQVFKQGITSYRDLPYRLCEFGKVHRYEPSGSLHGMLRVRAFTQDDAHIFCTPEQITDETISVCNLILDIYKDFGFKEIIIKYADRPKVRVGEDHIWDEAENALISALEKTGLDYVHNPGEGAFYGPKLEFVLRDAIGRDWQCGTHQVDLNLPARLDATYVGEDGQKHTPVLLHRAMFGSLERFIGILIEHHAGNLPLWLSPLPVKVLTITSKADNYAKEVVKQLNNAGIQAECDLRNEKISYKVREHSLSKVPVLFAVGHREIEEETVAIRRLGSKEQITVKLNEAIQDLQKEIKAPSAK